MTGDVAAKLTAKGMNREEAERKGKLFEMAEGALDVHQGNTVGGIGRWFVPGRIEVFGKHTDYAGGRSLLSAVERGICVVAIARDDHLVRVTDARRNEAAEISIDKATKPREPGDWTIYPRTAVRRLARNFPGAIAGSDMAFASDLPASAGLSSSSALITGIFAALAERNHLEELPAYRAAIRSKEELAGYLGAVENGSGFGPLGGEAGVGTFGGSEDHTAILCCRAGRLSQFSFCPVRREREVTLPADWVFVVGVSGVAADKAGAARESYNRASASARAILELWRAATGREDATLAAATAGGEQVREQIREILRHANHPEFSSRALADRFEQFCQESEALAPGAAAAFEKGDMKALGELAARSQEGAERGLGNQVAETVELVKSARALGAGAASAFGAGFGGSVWAATRRSEAETFRSEWERTYRRKFPQHAEQSQFFLSGAGPGMIRIS